MRVTCLLLCLSLVQPLAAQQVSPATPQQIATLPSQRDPLAVAALQSAHASLGGASQALPVSLSASGTHTDFATSSPPSYPIRIMALGTTKIRWETDLPSGTVVSIIRGRRGWTQDTDGITALSVGRTVGQGVENFPLLAFANWANLPNVLVKLVGPETLDGAKVVHVSLTESGDPSATPDSEKILRTARQCELYIDQQTNLPVRLRYFESLGDWRRSIPVDLAFSNYKSVGGFLFPFTLTRYRAGQLSDQTQLSSVVFNQPLSDDLFWVNQP
jgi:hypothetical protein